MYWLKGHIAFYGVHCCLPGQEPVLHILDCILLPLQAVPPLQFLDRVLLPPLQVWLQLDQDVHKYQDICDPPPKDSQDNISLIIIVQNNFVMHHLQILCESFVLYFINFFFFCVYNLFY